MLTERSYGEQLPGVKQVTTSPMLTASPSSIEHRKAPLMIVDAKARRAA